MKPSFEQHLSEKLKAAEWQASDQVLNNILDKRRSKSKPWLFWVIGLAVASISVVMMWYESESTQSPKLTEQHPNISENQYQTKGADSESTKQAKSSHNSEQTHAKKGKRTPRSIADVKPSHPIPSNANVKPLVPEVPQSMASNDRTDGSSKAQSLSQAAASKRADKQFENTQIKPAKVLVQDNTKWRVKANDMEQLIKANNGQVPEFILQSSKGQSRLLVYNNPKLLNEQFELDRDFLYSRAALIKKVKVLKQFEDLNHVNAQNEYALNGRRPTEQVVPQTVYLDMMMTPSIGYAAVNSNNDLAVYNPDIMHVKGGYSVAARISVPLKNALSLIAGIQVKQQQNLYNGNIHYRTNELDIQSTTYYINDPIQGVIPVTIYDTTRYVKDNLFNVNHANTYKMTQVPLGVSYQFGLGKSQFAFNTACVLNWVSKASGKQIDVNQKAVTAFEFAGKSFSMGGNISLMTAYPIAPRFKLFVEPGVQWFKIKAIGMGNNFNEAVINYNASFGLRYSVF